MRILFGNEKPFLVAVLKFEGIHHKTNKYLNILRPLRRIGFGGRSMLQRRKDELESIFLY